jgi:hypothetical protein
MKIPPETDNAVYLQNSAKKHTPVSMGVATSHGGPAINCHTPDRTRRRGA